MTNRKIQRIAIEQSAVDSSCLPEDFLKEENTVVISKPSEGARRYLSLPFECNLTSHGKGIVASVSEELRDDVTAYINRFSPEHCFETPNLHVLMDILRPKGLDICFMAEYFLPDTNIIKPLECEYKMRFIPKENFEPLYSPLWSNALCKDRKHLDMIALGAFHGEKLIGLAGASADCDTMWQIGIDVLPEYRRQGVASALTSTLAVKILDMGIVPFYCRAWSNIASGRNAINSGFRPAWVTVTAKPREIIDNYNKKQG